RMISQIDGLSSVTVLLPRGTARVPGVYSYILKFLAWEGINVVEVVSTLNEFTIILEEKNIDSSFSIIKRIFA
ncbi:MAG: aspartate kinase, partial [Acidobacteriota bacterium]